MLIEKTSKSFANGVVYLMHTDDGYPIETTDTFLPFYTKDAIGRKQNDLISTELGSRDERYIIGVSTMSGCPVRCKFCATGTMKKCRNLTADEIVEQVLFILRKHPDIDPTKAKEFKINYTRMGEPFLNIENVRKAIEIITEMYPNTHHYISTIGIKGADYSWIKGNVTLQVSLHSLRNEKRNWLIPFKHKVTIRELGKIRTQSNLKTTINMTLVEEDDFDIVRLKRYFSRKKFFVKLSPVNPCIISENNDIGSGIIKGINLV